MYIEAYVNDLSLWYIRRSRGRVGVGATDKSDEKDFYEVAWLILVNLSRILAPFVPFMSELIFTNLTKLPSVHLSDWPSSNDLTKMMNLVGKKKEVEILIKQMKFVREVVEKGHSLRKKLRIAVRQPLNSITIYTSQKCDLLLVKLIEDELNVKSVIWKKGKILKVKFDTKITPELQEEAKTRELIRKIQDTRKEMGIELTQKVNVTNQWLPGNTDLTQYIKKVTLTRDLSKGEFKVKKSS